MNAENECQVCGLNDKGCQKSAIRWHYGVVICEACKKFFIRSENDDFNKKYKCKYNEQCSVMIETRNNCKYCRYQKCKTLGMDLKSKEICSVCPQIASGIHFGVLTCEGGKGFFRRSNLNEKFKSYKCKSSAKSSDCKLNSCQFCKYEKCIKVRMSTEKCKIGRGTNMFNNQQSNLVINKSACFIRYLNDETQSQ